MQSTIRRLEKNITVASTIDNNIVSTSTAKIDTIISHDDINLFLQSNNDNNTNDLDLSLNKNLIECLIKEHLELQIYGNSSNDYCPTFFDSILCLPRTQSSTLLLISCPDQISGVRYDSTQNATRYCHANGTWDTYTNYDSCIHLSAPSIIQEFEPFVELPTIVYYIGYSISLISLTLALIVFSYYKELRCLRNTIHANLFFTYIMSGLLWILTLSVQISVEIGLAGCIFLVTSLHFFTLTNFFWMLVEGLYLYILVVKTFSGDNIRFSTYAIIGWGGPAIFVITWAIAKGLTSDFSLNISKEVHIDCPWMHETTVDWIFQGPVCAVLIMNLIFLLMIMWVLITKLRSANNVETKQYRKATKALLVLIPLFGITYLVVLAGPNKGVSGYIFGVARAFLLSTQGFSVSLFYCFLNSEVRTALRHHVHRWQEERNIRLGQLKQSRRYPTKSFKQNNLSPRSRAESIRPLTSIYNKRESCVSSVTTTSLVGPPSTILSYHQRGSNGTLQPNITPRPFSPLMQHEENSV